MAVVGRLLAVILVVEIPVPPPNNDLSVKIYYYLIVAFTGLPFGGEKKVLPDLAPFPTSDPCVFLIGE